MSKYTAVIYCDECAKELVRIEAKDPPITEPNVFVSQVHEMTQEFKLSSMFCQECRNRRMNGG